MSGLHVAVVNLTGGGLSGGYRKYLRELLPRLREQPQIGVLTMLSPASVTGIPDDIADAQLTWPVHDEWLGFSTLRARLKRLKPDVVFFPTARLLRTGIPTVVMVRNMEPLVVARDGHTRAMAVVNLARRQAARRSCRLADRVIAVSDYVKEFLTQTWHMDPAKIAVVYHGVADGMSAGARRPRHWGLDSRCVWLFTAGSIRPARGLTDAINAIVWLRARGRDVSLVIAGAVDRGCERYHASALQRAAACGVADRITWTGALDDDEMRWCFENCTQFLMTSRAEACPNIALEAMSAGAACVAADNPPLPEFYGPAARYYAPGAGDALGERIAELLDVSPEQRQVLRGLARHRAAAFRWDTTAARTTAELLACAQRR